MAGASCCSLPDRCSYCSAFGVDPRAKRGTIGRRLDSVGRGLLVGNWISGTEIDQLSVLDDTSGVVDVVTRRQEQTLLAEAIRTLPERCREVLILRKIHGLSQKEIAARL